MKKLILKPGREKTLLRRHPWVFSGALENPKEAPDLGETVLLVSSKGEPLALAAYSPHSQIRARIWSFDPSETINLDFFRRRLKTAVEMRKQLPSKNDSARRLVNGESDGLPALIVDQYGSFLSCQFLSAGTERWKKEIVQALQELLQPEGIYERSDVDVREKEGLPNQTGLLYGTEPPALIPVEQNGIRFWIDIRKGHKTGGYLDQRENRAFVEQFASGMNVLNCFSYTGGFAFAALRGGANHVLNIDASEEALQLAEKNRELNGLPQEKISCLRGDVFTLLRKFRDEGKQFDLIILDPPKFISSTQQVIRGGRGYKDINLQAIKLLKPGGLLFTFSCSGHLSRELFEKIVADAAVDAKRDLRFLHYLNQAPDHPVASFFPEGHYLKGLVCWAR